MKSFLHHDSHQIFYITFALFFFINNALYGSIIHAESTSQIDVQGAIDKANSGDRVFIPSGKSTWAKSVIINAKSLYIFGQGITKTIIKDETGSSFLEAAFKINVSGDHFVRISKLTLINSSSSSYGSICVYNSGGLLTGNNIQIDSVKIDSLCGRGITVLDQITGVIAECIFDNRGIHSNVQGVSVFGLGDESWDDVVDFGSDEFIFIEDCTFNYSGLGDGALDAYGGARYVFRYNTVINTIIGHHGRDSGGYRSTHMHEVYNNQFINSGLAISRLFLSRGGTGIIHNNVWSGAFNLATGEIELAYYCAFENETSCGEPWNQCRTYPCIDQPGRGTDQTLVPCYEWNNFKDGVNVGFSVVEFNETEFDISEKLILENRDYFNDQMKPEYTPYIYPHPLRRFDPPNLKFIE